VISERVASIDFTPSATLQTTRESNPVCSNQRWQAGSGQSDPVTICGCSVKPAKATRWTPTSVLIGFETEPGDHDSLRYLWLAVDDVARVIRPALTTTTGREETRPQ